MRSFVAGGTTAVSFLRSPAAAAVSVKQVPESGGLTLRLRTHRCKACKLAFSGAKAAADHKASNRQGVPIPLKSCQQEWPLKMDIKLGTSGDQVRRSKPSGFP